MKEKSCGMIVFNEGKVLIIKQTSGFYGFPKGHVEEGETEIETAIRETREETNIECYATSEKRYTVSYLVKDNIPKEVVFFLGKPVDQVDPKNQESEVSEVLFVDIDKVRDILSFDDLKGLWDKVLEDLND